MNLRAYRWLIIIYAVAAASGPVHAQPPAAPQDAILLEGGHVLRGRVTDEGDRVLLTLGPGSRIRLPKGRVVAVGRSLEDLFHAQRRRLARDDVAGRIRLAQWCLQQQLPAFAGQVMVELARIAPYDQDVRNLERQLRYRYTHRAEIPPPAAAKPTQPQQLDSITDELSPAAMEMFMHRIQPVLINHCAASGCHGIVGRNEFHLLRAPRGLKMTRRMTQRNLRAALTQIDRHEPQQSPLLGAATSPHGKLDRPVLNGLTEKRELAALKQWVEMVASSNGEPSPSPESDTPPQSNETPPSIATPITGTTPQPTRPVATDNPSAMPPTDDPASAAPPGEDDARAIPPARDEEARRPPAPRDAFDADIFNRRFFPERFRRRSPGRADEQRPMKRRGENDSSAAGEDQN